MCFMTSTWIGIGLSTTCMQVQIFIRLLCVCVCVCVCVYISLMDISSGGSAYYPSALVLLPTSVPRATLPTSVTERHGPWTTKRSAAQQQAWRRLVAHHQTNICTYHWNGGSLPKDARTAKAVPGGQETQVSSAQQSGLGLFAGDTWLHWTLQDFDCSSMWIVEPLSYPLASRVPCLHCTTTAHQAAAAAITTTSSTTVHRGLE